MDGSAADQVTVRIDGPGAQFVVASDGSDEFTCDQGFLTVAIIAGIVPTESNPITFRVMASAPGYLKSSQRVTFYKLGGEALVIRMVELDHLPNGVAAVTGSLVTNGNGAMSSVSFNSGDPQTTFQQTSAKVTIPQGTIMKNASGNALVGEIDVTLAYFNNLDESSLSAFPGGFATQTVSDGDVVFTTGGFVSLEMSKESNGQQVSTFNTPIQLTIQIPDGSMDDLGNPIAVNDEVAIWSYNTTTGAWDQELPVIAVLDGVTGNIEVNFPVTHLSYWNISWHQSACPVGATINVTSNISCSNYLYMKIRNAATGTVIAKGQTDLSDGSIRLVYAPQASPVVVEVYEHANSTTALGSVLVSNACGGTYTMDFDVPSPHSEVEIQVNLRCADRPNFILRPTLPLWSKLSGGSWVYIGQMVNGNFSTCALTMGTTYEFATLYDGKFYISPTPHTVSQTTYVFERELTQAACNSF